MITYAYPGDVIEFDYIQEEIIKDKLSIYTKRRDEMMVIVGDDENVTAIYLTKNEWETVKKNIDEAFQVAEGIKK
jgi:hypothetical protein